MMNKLQSTMHLHCPRILKACRPLLPVGIMVLAFPVFSSAQNGRVGINTASPAAALHVADSSVVFTGLFPLPNPVPPPPVTGSGTRLMWHTGTASLRVGAVTGNRWDLPGLGAYSIAAGLNSLASGGGAMAIGDSTSATGTASAAFGSKTTASGLYATAFGRGSQATNTSAVAFGDSTQASGTAAMASGRMSKATGNFSFASGHQTTASGNTSQSFGELSRSVGSFSTAFGYHSIARAGYSFVIGRYNDTTAISTTTWNASDPLFIVGNGSAHTSRRNAMTILKNGNVGLFTHTPIYRLHVTNDNPADGGYVEGIMIENTNAVVGESALSFKNKSLPGQRKWITGLDQNPKLSFNYGNGFDPSTTLMTLDTMGRLGLKTTSPSAMLHVVRNAPSGGSFNANAMAIFESNQPSFIQLSSENTDETGILSGNQVTAIRSAIVFAADSSILLRAGGNSTRMAIEANGNVGIGTTAPSARLDVNGNFKLGLNGTVVEEIIKVSANNINLPSIASGSTLTTTFTVTNAQTGSAVAISPSANLGDGVVIASCRVSAANTVEARIVNTTGAAVDPPIMSYYITVIR